MTLNLGSLLADSARRLPNAVALISGAERCSYSELDLAARRFAVDLMQSGVQPGDKVALMAPNSPEFTVAYFGILYAGGVVVTLNTLQTTPEVAFQLSDSEAVAVVFHSQFSPVVGPAAQGTACKTVYVIEPHAESQLSEVGWRRFADTQDNAGQVDVVPRMPDDTAVILYTSGTTGQPKGAELTHFNLYYNAKFCSERIAGDWPSDIHVFGPGDVGLAALPLYHIFGQTNIQNGMLMGGAALSYLERYEPQLALEVCKRDGVTFFPGVPTMFFAIMNDVRATADDLASIHLCVSGGAPMPGEVKRTFEERFGIRIREGYGLTETSPLASLQLPSRSSKSGCIGQPIEGVEMRVADEEDNTLPVGEIGEILIRGHNVMKGYYRRPEATAAAMRGGWFHSGDMAYVDEDGDFFIVDRKKDLILRGGYNVYPREVEEVLYQHPAVREAVVIGMPDERYGEEVKAVISLKEGCDVSPEEITEHCKQRVAAYKYPRCVEILDDLPKGPTGKLLKRALREEQTTQQDNTEPNG